MCADSSVMRCGRIVVVGEEPQDPRIDTIEIAQKEIEIIGSRNGTRQDMQDAIRLVAAGMARPLVRGPVSPFRISTRPSTPCVKAFSAGLSWSTEKIEFLKSAY